MITRSISILLAKDTKSVCLSNDVIYVPSFMIVDPDTIGTIQKLSPLFHSLVDFVKDGNTLDETASRRACTLLEAIAPHLGISMSPESGLTYLYPKSKDTIAGFADSLVTLLISSNENIVKATLSLLNEIMWQVGPLTRFSFLASGFFGLLPKAFYFQEMHVLPGHKLFLMDIVSWMMDDSNPTHSRLICRRRNITITTFREIFIDKFIQPIEPFLEFVFQNRRKIEDTPDSRYFSQMLGEIIEKSPLMDQMTKFVLSSSFALTSTDCLVLFDSDVIPIELLQKTMYAIWMWAQGSPTVQKRGRQILTQLNEEGLSDELDLHIRSVGYDLTVPQKGFLGMKLIRQMGGNTPDIRLNN
ncbi:hypothetical protein BLNAU_10590 [Blattamonas nauphoetae]|uniref:Uncharacterized protein n=1 Tax=Blattamonas nauphoetae TaxID=2049346 RepID=A0ABQ9XRZ3_9EUKA|nr:hypothetical protein BLNAU_10590 [Blattamonas nauphoetae]